MAERHAVYAGSFDPVTRGHLWVIEQGARLFDRLTVAVAVNPDKRYAFPLAERLGFLREATAHLPGVAVEPVGNVYLVDHAQTVGAGFLLRGVRTPSDWEYELRMRGFNERRVSAIATVFLAPPADLVDVSSSFVKGLVGPAGWADAVAPLVPPPVLVALLIRQSRADWRALWGRLIVRGADPAAGPALLDDLLRRHQEPHRAYHDLLHLLRMREGLAAAAAVGAGSGAGLGAGAGGGAGSEPGVDADAVELAIWFHDAVYDPRAADNEARSAALAYSALAGAGLAAPLIERVTALIAATAAHTAPAGDAAAALLLDLDLAILAAPEPAFTAYDRGIRREYAWVDDGAYAAGRRSVLQGFLDRPALYATPRFRERYEAVARANLRAAIAQLTPATSASAPVARFPHTA